MGVYIVTCLCLDRSGPGQAYPGQAEVLRKGTEGKGERGEEGQRDEKEETKLSGDHEVAGGIRYLTHDAHVLLSAMNISHSVI